MSLKIVRGRAGSGKSTFLLEDMHASENSIYIVPEQFSFSAEKKLVEKFGVSGLGNPVCLSFMRLADTIFTRYGAPEFISDNSSFEMLVSYCANNISAERLRLFDGLVKKAQLGEAASALITTFRRYAITPEMLEEASEKVSDSLLKKKLDDSAIIYREYLAQLSEAGVTDLCSKLSALADIISDEKCDYFDNRCVYIDQFSDFDPSEINCIKMILKRSPRVVIALCGDDTLSFPTVERTYRRLISIAKEVGVKIEAEEIIDGSMRNANSSIKHLEENYFCDSPQKYTGNDGSVSIHCGENKTSEVHYIARQIAREVRQNDLRYRDMSVVARNIDDYKGIIDRVFPMYDIPVFVDRKISLASHSITVFITSILDIAISGFTYENVFSYIKSPFSPLTFEEADILENYCLAAGVRPFAWSAPFKYKPGTYSAANGYSEDENSLEYINELRLKVYEPLINFRKNAEKAENAEGICASLFDFFDVLSLEEKARRCALNLEKNGENLPAMQTVQVYNVLVDIFSDICSVFGKKHLTLTQFANIVRAGLQSVEIGTIPVSLDCVSIGSIDRIKGHGSKYVFLAGVNADCFPAPPKDTGLFSDMDKDELESLGIEMPPNLLHKTESEQLLIYDALTCATDKLFVSFARATDSGASLLPSEIIENISKIFPNAPYTDDITNNADGIEMISSKKAVFDLLITRLRRAIHDGETLSPEMSGAGYFFSKDTDYAPLLLQATKMMNYTNEPRPVSAELIEKHVGHDMKTSISRLETYNKCPFSYFAQYILKLRPRQYFEVKASDSGSFLHDFLERFSEFMKESVDEYGNRLSWKTIDDKFIEDATNKVLAEILSGVNTAILEVPRIKALFTRLSRVAKRSVYTVKRHISHGEFVPLGYEISFDDNGNFAPIKIKLEDGKTVTLRGRIGRADEFCLEMPDGRKGSFARIVDYKSSERSFSLSNVYSGVQLQLFVYLSALCDNGYKPAGILYCNLSDSVVPAKPNSSEEEILKLRDDKSRMNGIVLADDDMEAHMGGKEIISSSKKISHEDFNAMFKHIRKTVKKTAEDIYSGKFSITCSEDACAWCDYKALCRYNVAFDGVKNLDIPKYKDEEIWAMLQKEVDSDEMD